MTRAADRDRGRAWQQLAARSLGDVLTDAELIGRLTTDARDAAFAALVHRHGPLVLGVCRRVLGDAHAAEDAFQATFLVLLQKADAASGVTSLAGWLHGVAVRVARKALTRVTRSRARERKVEPMVATRPEADNLDDARPILDEEIARLNADYQAPLVLCYFEGKTYQEAARILGWPEGTVSGRLARARELLRERLTRRGIVCSVAGLTSLLATLPAVAVPPALEAATMDFATGAGVAPTIASLTDAGTSNAGWLKWAAVGVLTVASVGAITFALVSPNEPKAEARPAEQLPLEESRFRHPAAAVSVAISPRNEAIITAGADESLVLWNSDGKLVRRLPGHAGGATAVVFAPDGHTFASTAHDGVTRVWNTAGDIVQALPAHGEAATAAAYSPDGRALATTGWDGQVRLWNLADRKQILALDAHRGKAWGVAFSLDGKTIATVGDKDLRVWNVDTGGLVHRLDGLKSGAYAVAFVDPRHVAISCDNTVSLWSLATRQEVARVGGPQQAVAVFAVSPDGRTIAWGGGDRLVHLWEIGTRQERLTLTLGEDVTALAFAPDGERLLAGGAGGQVVVWRLSRLAETLDDKRLTAAWSDLLGSDAARAFKAVRSLTAAPDVSLPFLADRLPGGPKFTARVELLIADLDASAYADRESATRELRSLGAVAGPALRKAVAETGSAEIRQRAEELLKRLPADDSLTGPMIRVLEVLECIGTPRARQLLTDLTTSKPETELTRQAEFALDRLRLRTPR